MWPAEFRYSHLRWTEVGEELSKVFKSSSTPVRSTFKLVIIFWEFILYLISLWWATVGHHDHFSFKFPSNFS